MERGEIVYRIIPQRTCRIQSCRGIAGVLTVRQEERTGRGYGRVGPDSGLPRLGSLWRCEWLVISPVYVTMYCIVLYCIIRVCR